jgi:hypothetical protein
MDDADLKLLADRYEVACCRQRDATEVMGAAQTARAKRVNATFKAKRSLARAIRNRSPGTSTTHPEITVGGTRYFAVSCPGGPDEILAVPLLPQPFFGR